MVRQCAWCLYLIDSSGMRLSALPLPKLYEASHGICTICGMMWIARATENHTGQGSPGQLEHKEPCPVSQPEYKKDPFRSSQKAPASKVPTGTLADC